METDKTFSSSQATVLTHTENLSIYKLNHFLLPQSIGLLLSLKATQWLIFINDQLQFMKHRKHALVPFSLTANWCSAEGSLCPSYADWPHWGGEINAIAPCWKVEQITEGKHLQAILQNVGAVIMIKSQEYAQRQIAVGLAWRGGRHSLGVRN